MERTFVLEKSERQLYILLALFLIGSAGSAILYSGIRESLDGFLVLQLHPARLINDFTAATSDGAAFLNASVAAACALLLIRMQRVQLSGPTFAAVLTIFGFGLFGKTLVNTLPVIIGVAISARIAGKSFKEYLLIALFGTALGPLVGFILFEMGLSGMSALAASIIAGLAAGMLLPPAAMAMLHLHQGYNLYNMGLTCGFIGLFAASVLSAMGQDMSITVLWNTEASLFRMLFIPVLSVYIIVCAFLFRGGRSLTRDLSSVIGLSGRLPTDFSDVVSLSGALLNTGLLGLSSYAYVLIVGGDVNGPVIGGMMTVMGFGLFGKHLKNCLPVVAGLVIAGLLFGKDLSAPGPLLAALFVTTLAPIAGEFGPLTGLIAGFLHLVMVERTGAWHAGIDLYNNGFAGGLTAALIISVIEWYRSSRPDDFSDGFSDGDEELR